MTKEELVRQAAKCFPSKVTTVKEEKSFIDGFIRGAEWMQEKMIEKAVEWINSQMYIENIFEYDEDNQSVRYVCASCCDTVDDFIEKFKQAME